MPPQEKQGIGSLEGIWHLKDNESNYGMATASENGGLYWKQQWPGGGGDEYPLSPADDRPYVYTGMSNHDAMTFDFNVKDQITISTGNTAWIFVKQTAYTGQALDLFLLHDPENRFQVEKISDKLQEAGFKSGFSDEPNPMQIDNAGMVVVFVTQQLVNKCSGMNGSNDPCKVNFDYCSRRKNINSIVPVVLDPTMLNTASWDGPVGMKLGGALYTAIIDDSTFEDDVSRLVSELNKRKQGAADSWEGIWFWNQDRTNWATVTASEDGGLYWKQVWRGGGAEEYKIRPKSDHFYVGTASDGRHMEFSFSPHKVLITGGGQWTFLREPTKDKEQETVDDSPLDFFLSHNWGLDELERSNHDRVAKINKKLQDMGFRTWFDEECMTGDIDVAMAKGIDRAKTAVLCITADYINKVAGKGPKGNNDNCKFEFDYATRRKGLDNLILLVMEPVVIPRTSWHGPLGLKVGGLPAVIIADDRRFDRDMAFLKQVIDDRASATTAEFDPEAQISRIVEALGMNITDLVVSRANKQLGLEAKGTTEDQIKSIMAKLELD